MARRKRQSRTVVEKQTKMAERKRKVTAEEINDNMT